MFRIYRYQYKYRQFGNKLVTKRFKTNKNLITIKKTLKYLQISFQNIISTPCSSQYVSCWVNCFIYVLYTDNNWL